MMTVDNQVTVPKAASARRVLTIAPSQTTSPATSFLLSTIYLPPSAIISDSLLPCKSVSSSWFLDLTAVRL